MALPELNLQQIAAERSTLMPRIDDLGRTIFALEAQLCEAKAAQKRLTDYDAELAAWQEQLEREEPYRGVNLSWGIRIHTEATAMIERGTPIVKAVGSVLQQLLGNEEAVNHLGEWPRSDLSEVGEMSLAQINLTVQGEGLTRFIIPLNSGEYYLLAQADKHDGQLAADIQALNSPILQCTSIYVSSRLQAVFRIKPELEGELRAEIVAVGSRNVISVEVFPFTPPVRTALKLASFIIQTLTTGRIIFNGIAINGEAANQQGFTLGGTQSDL